MLRSVYLAMLSNYYLLTNKSYCPPLLINTHVVALIAYSYFTSFLYFLSHHFFVLPLTNLNFIITKYTTNINTVALLIPSIDL